MYGGSWNLDQWDFTRKTYHFVFFLIIESHLGPYLGCNEVKNILQALDVLVFV